MQRVCLHMVLKMSSSEQKVARVSMARDLIELADAHNNFLENTISGDKRCFLYDHQEKRL